MIIINQRNVSKLYSNTQVSAAPVSVEDDHNITQNYLALMYCSTG
jgi:hypothetical protein